MPSQRQMSDSPTLQPCTHFNSPLLLSSSRDMMVLSTTVTHSSEGGGVSTACVEREINKKKNWCERPHEMEMNYEKRLLWFCAFTCGCREEKLRVQHKGGGETLMWPSATERQEGSPDPGLFSLCVSFLSFSSCLTPCIMSELLQTDRQTDRQTDWGPAVTEPTGIHTAGGGGGDDGGFSACNWL